MCVNREGARHDWTSEPAETSAYCSGMNEPVETIELGSDESVFVIRDRDGSLVSVPPDVNTLVSVNVDEDFTEVWIHTGSQWGPFKVTTRTLVTPPPVGDEWEDVVEFSVRSTGGLFVSELVEGAPLGSVADSGGDYRLRVSARGRTEGAERDRSFDELDDDTTPVEHDLLEAWPAPIEQPQELRLASAFARDMSPPPRQPGLAEETRGLEGTRAIGRDLDGGPSARSLSGRLGNVRASRSMPGTRRRLYRAFAHFGGWHEGYGFMGGVDVRVGEHFRSDSEKPVSKGGDGMTGTAGYLEHTWLDFQSPKLVVRSWNWFIPGQPVGQVERDWVQGRPFLSEPSTLRVDLTEFRAEDGAQWTTVQIEHQGLPEEWLDDMTAYWEWNLAIADQRGLGLH
jgi:hypothetical protein